MAKPKRYRVNAVVILTRSYPGIPRGTRVTITSKHTGGWPGHVYYLISDGKTTVGPIGGHVLTTSYQGKE